MKSGVQLLPPKAKILSAMVSVDFLFLSCQKTKMTEILLLLEASGLGGI